MPAEIGESDAISFGARRCSAAPPPEDASRNATSSGITWSGASSISQCPDPLTTTPFTFVATRRAWSIRNSPEAFSPVSTSTGIASGVAASAAKSCASFSKLRKYSKPARIPPGCA